MPLPPAIIPAKRRRHRKRRAAVTSSPVAEGPALVAASFDADTVAVLLTFDRAVNLTGFVPADLVVRDGNLSGMWVATTEVSQDAPGQLIIAMADDGPFVGEGVKLTATDGAGIVAADSGGAWAGVMDLNLPFP